MIQAENSRKEPSHAMRGWLTSMNDDAGSRRHGDLLKALLPELNGNRLLREIEKKSELFTKKSYWVFAGDGAAYDIAFGGIDHVLACGEDINVFNLTTRSIQIPAASLSRQLQSVRSPSSPPPARKRPKKSFGPITTYTIQNIIMESSINREVK